MKEWFKTYKYPLAYSLVGIFIAVSYYFVRAFFINMDAFGFALTSQLTFNIVIMFGLWGGLHQFIIKVKNPYMDKVVLVLGFIVIVLILRLFGLTTIFG
jgi:hypothetical protein